MRAKTAAFLKVLNRAKPEPKSNPINIPGNWPSIFNQWKQSKIGVTLYESVLDDYAYKREEKREIFSIGSNEGYQEVKILKVSFHFGKQTHLFSLKYYYYILFSVKPMRKRNMKQKNTYIHDFKCARHFQTPSRAMIIFSLGGWKKNLKWRFYAKKKSFHRQSGLST